VGSPGIFQQFALDIQAATRAVPGVIPGNVAIGQVELLSNGGFWQHVADTGYVFVIGQPSGTARFLEMEADFEVEIEMLYPVLADASDDWSGPNAMLAAVVASWASWTKWASGQNRTAIRIRWDKPVVRVHEKATGKFLATGCEPIESFICSTKFTAWYPFVADQGVAPSLQPGA
jgi:hypothetical protein